MSIEARRRLVALGLLPEQSDPAHVERAMRIVDFAAWLNDRFPRKPGRPREYVRVAHLTGDELEARRQRWRIYRQRHRLRAGLKRLQSELDQYNRIFE